MKKIGIKILVICVLGIFGLGHAQKKEVQVVLLAGQSNMVGNGNYEELDEAVRARIDKIKDRVLYSNHGKAAKPLSYNTIKPSEKYPYTKSFGPELFIGLTLAEAYPDQQFLLIKKAQGGTALYGAWNPEWSAEKAQQIEKGFKQKLDLNKMHITAIHKNLKALEASDQTYKIIGMAWMQGENDAVLDVSADTYATTLKKLIAKYRKEFDVKNMPFVIGQINSRYGVKNGAARVRAAMETVASEDDYVGIIKTSTDTSWSDYPKNPDNVHYNAEGQKRLGTAFAKEIISLQN